MTKIITSRGGAVNGVTILCGCEASCISELRSSVDEAKVGQCCRCYCPRLSMIGNLLTCCEKATIQTTVPCIARDDVLYKTELFCDANPFQISTWSRHGLG